jgi:hypothetical protein
MVEPTKAEIERMRRRYKEASSKIFGPKFISISELPKPSAHKRNFLIATRLPEFPILIFSCSEDLPLSCLMERFCYLEGGPKIQSIAGAAYSAKRNEVLLSDNKAHRIYRYKYQSCLHVSYKSQLDITKYIPEISAFHVDYDDNLWIASHAPALKESATLFYWTSKEW